MPDTYIYIQRIVENMNSTVFKGIQEGKRIWPNEVLENLGQYNKIKEYDEVMYPTIDAILSSYGYRKKGTEELVNDTSLDLSKITDLLLENIVGKMSEEEFVEKWESQRYGFGYVRERGKIKELVK